MPCRSSSFAAVASPALILCSFNSLMSRPIVLNGRCARCCQNISGLLPANPLNLDVTILLGSFSALGAIRGLTRENTQILIDGLVVQRSDGIVVLLSGYTNPFKNPQEQRRRRRGRTEDTYSSTGACRGTFRTDQAPGICGTPG